MVMILGGSGTANGITSFSSPAVFGSTLQTASRGISSASIPSGSIIQVQQTVKTDSWLATPAATTYAVVTGLSVSLTPTSSTSKVFVMLNMWIGVQNYLFKGLVKRNGTILTQGDAAGNRPRCSFAGGSYAGNNESYSMEQVAFNYLDSPATTAICTYTVEAACYSTLMILVNRSYAWQNTTDYDGAPMSTITAMEIAQ